MSGTSAAARRGTGHVEHAGRRSRAAGARLRGAARETSRRLARAAAATRHAGRALDDAVRTHRSGLQGARRLVGKGLTRVQQIIQHCEQTRGWNGPSR